MERFEQLEKELRRTLQADRFRLRRQLRSVQQAQQAGKPFDRSLDRLEADVKRSVDLREKRRLGVPKVTYDEDLPISSKRAEISAAIRDNQVVVLCGETGSGKSTQLPKICLELGRGIDGLIGHTQPRRIAARSVASRIAEELKVSLGQQVGFKIRFTDVSSPQTYIKLMTDGILLAESQNDRFFDQYDTLILDEAHERSLNIDFLLGLLHRVLPRRRDLKLIITSATIDADRFSEHFRTPRGPAPIVMVSGRTYPVDVLYRPIELEEGEDEPDWQQGVLNAVDELADLDSGSGSSDMLIFMPTERDIHETAKSLRGRKLPGDNPGKTTEIVPLYARLSAAEQSRIFQPHPHRRIVIATNVAESSLTVPGIRYVIDPGTARISRYAPRSKVQRLPIEPISQASADQRKGRCGRIGPGTCIRLYSEQDYQSRDRFTAPEIQRTNLASVILQTLALKLGDIADFPFLDPPKQEAIKDGYATLFELGAIDDKRELTPLGRRLSTLPVDPRIGRIVLAGHDENCLRETLIIAAALELQDPRDRPVDKQQAADEKHAQFAHEDSDFLSYLKIWDFYDKLDKELSHSKLRHACHQNFLSFNRMREWIDIHLQLLKLVEQAGMRQAPRKDDYNAIHRALLTGLLSNIALRGETSEYTVAGGGKAFLWPGSGTIAKKPKWIVAGEVVETSRRYLRAVARIDPNWIERLSEHLVTRTYSEPHWSEGACATMAFERVSLFGLTIVPRRGVAYGAIDPVVSREFMVRDGLAAGNFKTKGEFLLYNQLLKEELESLQKKSRRGDFVVDDERAYAFYNERVPADVYDGPRFEKWRREAEKTQPQLLQMTRDDLLTESDVSIAPGDFPDRIGMRQMQLSLEYRFDPGNPADGITITVPKEAVNQLDPHRMGWLVPGLLEEKIVALIKSLPKQQRVAFIPVADTAKRVFKALKFGEGSFEGQIAKVLTDLGPEPISADAFRQTALPDHLRMNVRVVEGEKTLAASRDLAALRQELGGEAAASFTAVADSRWNRDGITKWDFGDLPEWVDLDRSGVKLRGFPTLVDLGDSVGLRLLDSAEQSAWKMKAGLRRLFFLTARKDVKTQVDWLPGLEKSALYATGLFTESAADKKIKRTSAATTPVKALPELPPGSFRQQVTELMIARAFQVFTTTPRSAAQFEKHLTAGRARLGVAVQDLTNTIEPLFKGAHEARRAINSINNPIWQYAAEDTREQFRHLTAPGFLTNTPWEWLIHLPRYFLAIQSRLSRLANAGLARDQKLHAQVAPLWQRYVALAAETQAADRHEPRLVQYRWMLEEFRVSLFAQELQTAIPVSEKRLEKLWEELRTGVQ